MMLKSKVHRFRYCEGFRSLGPQSVGAVPWRSAGRGSGARPADPSSYHAPACRYNTVRGFYILKLMIAIFYASFSVAADLTVCVSANDFAAQYGYDKASADAKYKGRALLINGIVQSVRLNRHEVDLKSA